MATLRDEDGAQRVITINFYERLVVKGGMDDDGDVPRFYSCSSASAVGR